MCGIAGLLTSRAVEPETVRRLIAPIAHRGPDDHGIWVDQEAGIGLGHQRLAIIDLTPAGHQPMLSADGRFVLNFNGEIYNHGELRRALEQRGATPPDGWLGHSDTETLVECIAALGLAVTLTLAVGMFAFALWDRRERTLSLVRDRFGEKPLYYGWAGRDFLFGSELKALRAHPGFDNPINCNALRQFAARTYIPAPLSIYERVFKLEPGCILAVKLAAAAAPRSTPPVIDRAEHGLKLTRYWSYRDVVRAGLDAPITDPREAIGELERTLAMAIAQQSMADVPVGTFLSGGIDSSTIVGLYQKYSSTPVRTFTIGFEQAGFDEAPYAKAVAAHFGTVHNEHYVTVEEARDVIPLLPAMYDEPFADSSQIPTFLVSRFARQQVTVALTGDGGDELFAGYNRHFRAPIWWKRLRAMPLAMRVMASRQLSRIPVSLWDRAIGVFPGSHSPHLAGKLQKAARVAGSARSFDDVYASFLDEWSFEASPVRGGDIGQFSGLDMDPAPAAPNELRMMYCDAVSYLPDDILCKVDRASMAVSLETRVPFLDHRVAELAARIPLSQKIERGTGKHILRRLLYQQAPKALFDRPKAGFAIPVGEWIKGPLRPWAEDLLDPRRMAQDGFLDPSVISSRWNLHLSGQRESTPALWAVLMFQAWLREQGAAAQQAA